MGARFTGEPRLAEPSAGRARFRSGGFRPRVRIPSLLTRPAVLASLGVHLGLAVGASVLGGGGPAVRRPPVEAPSVAFEFADAETPDPTPANEFVETLPEPDVVRAVADVVVVADAVAVEGLEVPPDEIPPEELAALAPAAPTAVSSVTRSTIAVRLRPPPPAPAPAPASPPSSSAGSGPGDRGRVVTPPVRLATLRAPDYPLEARVAGFEGVVVLRVAIRADGSVATVEVHASSGHALLDRAAEGAVGTWAFAPARLDGVPAPMTVLVPVTFRLRGAD